MSSAVPSDTGQLKESKTSEWVDKGLEVSNFVLTTLNEAANFAPVPFLQQAAGLTLGILKLVQQARGNKDLFKRLAEDSCRLVYSVAVIYAEREREGGHQPDDLNNDVGDLVGTLTSIDNFARKQASRNFFLRIIFSGRDAGSIQEYRERLRHSLDVFWLQSSIRVREGLSDIAKQQGEMYQALQDQGQGEGRKSKKSKSSDQPDRLEVLSATQYTHEIFKSSDSFTHNQVAGNQVNTVNSGNTTTTKKIGSVIGGSGGHGGVGGTAGGAGGGGGSVTFSFS